MKNTDGTIRLLVQVGMILLAAAVVWGTVRHNVADNTEDIKVIKEVDIPKIDKDKLDKEVFSMYLKQEKEADDKRDVFLNKMDDKLDKVLAK